jgi:hypothetical protein
MSRNEKKIVFCPIEVPVGDFCWDGGVVCGNFYQNRGSATCKLGMIPVLHLDRGDWSEYKKPKECLGLKGEMRKWWTNLVNPLREDC